MNNFDDNEDCEVDCDNPTYPRTVRSQLSKESITNHNSSEYDDESSTVTEIETDVEFEAVVEIHQTTLYLKT